MYLWAIVSVRCIPYLLKMIFLNLSHIYEFLYNLVTVLYKFLKTGTSDRNVICRDHLLKFYSFSLYPFHFTLTVPLIIVY